MHDQSRGRDIAQALAVCAAAASRRWRAERERQEVRDAQQIAGERGGRRDGQSVVHDDLEADDALARCRARAAELEDDGIEPLEQEIQQQPERHAEAAHERGSDAARVGHHQPDQPIEQKRVEPRAQARGTQLEQYALGRLGGHDRVEHLAAISRRLRPDDDRVGDQVVNALPPLAEDEQ